MGSRLTRLVVITLIIAERHVGRAFTSVARPTHYRTRSWPLSSTLAWPRGNLVGANHECSSNWQSTSPLLQKVRPKLVSTIIFLSLLFGLSSNPVWAAPATKRKPTLSLSSQYLVRILFQRGLAFVYGVAFWIALRQNKALIGDRGIQPARLVLDRAQARGQETRQRRLRWRLEQRRQSRPEETCVDRTLQSLSIMLKSYRRNLSHWIGSFIDENKHLSRLRQVWDCQDASGRPITTLLWLARNRDHLNPWLDNVALTGLVLSGIVLARGAANVPLMLALWACQRSIMAVGGPFYRFGWEPQLAELGFHACFLVPLLSLDPIPAVPMSPLVVWLVRWYLFRIMMGAGLIKLKSGDRKWRDLTAMRYFYETQPVPNPVSRYMHWMPAWFHTVEVVMNHVVEVIAPWILLIPNAPTGVRRAGGLVQMVFQLSLILTGNLSFLNWLTMIPSLLCLDDAFVGGLFSQGNRERAAQASVRIPFARGAVSFLFAATMLLLSIPVVQNLASKKQAMNISYDPLRLVGSYGAFGTVTEERIEYIVSAASSYEGPWLEYEFQVKPGNVNRPPRFVSPYHYRLDWQMWIAAQLGPLSRSPWLFRLLEKLLQNDAEVTGLLAVNPFRDAEVGPKYIRVDRFRYRFHSPSKDEGSPPHWDREYMGRVFPRQGIASLTDIQNEIKAWH
jgi:lipase maturation factor 1